MNCKPIKPICPNVPVHESIKKLEDYRRYILKSLDCHFEKMVKSISVLSPEQLNEFGKVLDEYKEIEASIKEKINVIDGIITSQTSNVSLYHEYDPDTKNLSYRVGEKV